jgi:glutathione synthase/RimK-type ligase-like ATP-grasp enzyme
VTTIAVVGNPANRRVALFRAAALTHGYTPRVYAWSDVLAGLPAAPDLSEGFVRIESPGEDAGVDRMLRVLGSGDPEARTAEHGEILGTAAAHRGLGIALEHLTGQGGQLLNPPGDILTMSDKPRCHALVREAGIPVPEAVRPVTGWDDLRAALHDNGRVFVKPSHGSSASGVLALAIRGARVAAYTSVELAPDGRLFNNLRVRRYDREADVRAIVDRLAPDGLHVERWFPKAGLDDRVLDLRVVVTGGNPGHVVVRTSTSPMTNLHLGNARGDAGRVRRAAGKTWDQAMDTCVRVAACFPRSLHVAVDLMIGSRWRDHAVAEVNAFGDLLPGVLHDGRSTYEDQLSALTDGRYK